MFKVSGRGFHMFFKNGNTMSVTFSQRKGDQHYAEIGAWKPDGSWIQLGANEIIPYVEADELLEYMKKIAGNE